MKILKAITVLLLIGLIGCKPETNIKDEIKVFGGIELGRKSEVFSKQCDSLQVPSTSFYTKNRVENVREFENNQIFIYYKPLISMERYNGEFNSHIGLLYPTRLTGTENIIKLDVIIGISTHPINGLGRRYSELQQMAFEQRVSLQIVEDLRGLLTEKYGKPIVVSYMSSFNPIKVVLNNDIVSYMGRKDAKASITKWETDYLTVTLNEGYYDPLSVYYPEGKMYAFLFEESFDLGEKDDEISCRNYV